MANRGKIRRSIALLFTVSLLAACGTAAEQTVTEDTADVANSTDTVEETTEAEKTFVYTYPEQYAGTEFQVLNGEDIYNMHGNMDRDELTGEALDDAMYERCRTFEDLTGVTFVETVKNPDGALATFAKKTILSGDGTFDVMYISARDLSALIEGGYLLNLYDYDALQLSMPWWYSGYNDASTIGNALYAAAGSSQLMVIDSLWCLYFNETMMAQLDIETPYERVREGKWTLDELNKDIHAAANLNGDSSFSFTDGGSAVYGISVGDSTHFLEYAGEMAVELQDGLLTMTAGSGRYYNVVSKLASMLTTSDGAVFNTISGVVDGDAGSYITMFEDQRSLYLTAELSKTNRMRNFEWTFGIVPYPKYDESQESYYSTPFYATPNFTIPVSCSDPERAAILGDALTYISYDKVIPVYKDVTLEQKNLRNEESVEMLGIIMESSRPNLSVIFNVATDMTSAVVAKYKENDDEVSSIIAKYQSSVQADIDEINAMVQ